MKIYEKIFDRLDELHMSQMELSRRTGIATSTISDWRKKKINPQADKIVSICRALDMSLVDLLCDEETVEPAAQIDCLTNENYMIELFRQSDAESKRRIISYKMCIRDSTHIVIRIDTAHKLIFTLDRYNWEIVGGELSGRNGMA